MIGSRFGTPPFGFPISAFPLPTSKYTHHILFSETDFSIRAVWIFLTRNVEPLAQTWIIDEFP